jgi:hypothetical protein
MKKTGESILETSGMSFGMMLFKKSHISLIVCCVLLSGKLKFYVRISQYEDK